MLDFAFGELNLMPDEFWSLTWGEYYRMVKGYNRNFEQKRHTLAWLRATIYNTIPRAPGKAPYVADDFLEKEGEERTPEQMAELADAAIKRSEKFDKGGVVYDSKNIISGNG